jgi:hypothetical protein
LASLPCSTPAIPDSDFTEHENAGGVTRILVPGQREILITADHMDSCVFGSADRILVGVSAASSGVGGPFRPVVAFEDNPRRYAFSVSLGSNHEHCLVKPWQIQIFRIGKTSFVYWTIPLVAPATEEIIRPGLPTIPATPEVTLPPGLLILRGYDEPKSGSMVYPPYPSGWKVSVVTTSQYNAHATLFCPRWHYCGPVAEAYIGGGYQPISVTNRTYTWTSPS